MISNQKFSISGIQGAAAGLDVNQQDCVITIKIGTSLDLSLCDLFMKAIRHAQGSIRSRIVVDLENTHRIFDSGLALLMLLNVRSWRKSCKILIINCNPDIKQRIEQGLAPGIFNLSQVTSTLVAGSPSSKTEYQYQAIPDGTHMETDTV